MIITPGKSVTRAIKTEQRSRKTEENKHGAVIAGCSAESETLYWD